MSAQTFRGAAIAVTIVLAVAAKVRGALYTWDGEFGLDWHQAVNGRTNWDLDMLPGAADTATISNSSGAVTISEDVTIKDLTVFSSLAIGKNLTITGAGSINNLIIAGGHLGGPGTVLLTGQAELRYGGMESGADIRNSGTFRIVPGFGGQQAISNTTFKNFGTLEQTTGVTLFNSVLINNSNHTLINTGIANNGGGLLNNAGTISGTGASSVGVPLENSGILSATTTGSVLSITAGSTHTGGSVAVDQNATVALTGTALHTIGALTASGFGSLALNASNVQITGEVVGNLSGTTGLHLQSGVITGAGTITNENIALLSGAWIGNAGGVVNNAFGAKALYIDGGSTHAIATTLTNNGRVVHQNRQLIITAGAQVLNTPLGNYEIAPNAVAFIVGAGTFMNRGFLVKKGANEAVMSAVFDLAGGTVDVQGGTLSLTGTGGGSSAGTLKVAQGAALTLNNNYTFAGDYQFLGDGLVNLAGSTSFNGNASFQMPMGGVSFNGNASNLSVTGGTLENKAKFIWNGNGVISVSSLGRFVNAAGATLNIAGAQPFLNGALENEGTVNHANTATLRIGANSAFINRGQYHVTNGAVSQRNAGTHEFTNGPGGTFQLTGVSTFGVDMAFNNAGGTVTLAGSDPGPGATLNLDGGGTHTASGSFQIGRSSAIFLRGSHIAVGSVSFAGQGAVYLNGSYTANTGVTTFDMGGVGGDVFTLNNSSAQLTTAATAQIDNQGEFRWLVGAINGGSLDGNGNIMGGFRNSFETLLTGSSAKTLRGVFHNPGKVTHVQGTLRMDTGSVLINEGEYRFANLSFSPFIQALNAGGRFVNRGLVFLADNLTPDGATASISVPFDSQSGSVEVLDLALAFSGGGNFSGTGSFHTAPGATINFNGGNYDFIGAYAGSGFGTIRLSSGQIIGSFTSAMNPGGQFVLAGGTLNGPESRPIANTGTIVFEGGSIVGTAGLQNAGKATVSNSLTVAGRFANAGELDIPGLLSLTGTLQNQSGGTITISDQGGIGGSTGEIQNFGTLKSDRIFAAISAKVNNVGRVHVLPARHLTLAGQVTQFDPVAGSLQGGSWTVEGELKLGNGELIRILNANVEIRVGGKFINLPSITSGNFTNSGQLALNDQTNRAVTGKFMNSGSVTVGANTKLSAPELESSGVVWGNGTIEGALGVSGSIHPGSSPGILTVIGSLNLAPGASLAIEIQGAMAGTEYDVLAVAGPAALGGSLQLSLPLGNSIPLTSADELTILTATSVAGTFANLPSDGWLMSSDGSAKFHVAIEPDAVVLSQFTPIPEPGTLLFCAATLPLLLSRRHRKML